jgi:hypothetical protein
MSRVYYQLLAYTNIRFKFAKFEHMVRVMIKTIVFIEVGTTKCP